MMYGRTDDDDAMRDFHAGGAARGQNLDYHYWQRREAVKAGRHWTYWITVARVSKNIGEGALRAVGAILVYALFIFVVFKTYSAKKREKDANQQQQDVYVAPPASMREQAASKLSANASTTDQLYDSMALATQSLGIGTFMYATAGV